MNFIKNMDNELLKKLVIIIGAIIILFIVLIVFLIITGGRLSYPKIEKRMISAAQQYYKDNSEELPKVDNGTVSISAEKLAEEKYMKPLNKLVKDKDAVCSGKVTVTKNEDNLLYSAALNCGSKYETKKLKDVITQNVVVEGNGIYQIDDDYVFRGDKVNNYIKYANKLWRILRINSDGTIRIIETTKRDSLSWDDRYNSDRNDSSGINDFSVSRIKDSLEEIYNDPEEFSNEDKAFLVKMNLCVGKRGSGETTNNGSIECASTIPNQSIGLIQVNEFALASLSQSCKAPEDPECTNYNYLANSSSFWTLTADKNTSYKVFKIADGPFLTNAANFAKIKVVAHINSQVNYVSGDGTEEKPYVFQ